MFLSVPVNANEGLKLCCAAEPPLQRPFHAVPQGTRAWRGHKILARTARWDKIDENYAITTTRSHNH